MATWIRSQPALGRHGPSWRLRRLHHAPASLTAARDVAIVTLCALLSGGLLSRLLSSVPAHLTPAPASVEARG